MCEVDARYWPRTVQALTSLNTLVTTKNRLVVDPGFGTTAQCVGKRVGEVGEWEMQVGEVVDSHIGAGGCSVPG